MKNKHQKLFILPIALAVYALLLELLVWAERGGDNPIDTLPKALWYSLVTLTTVGYGDYTPQTLPGRLIGLVFLLMSTGLLALLIGLIAASFTDRLLPGFFSPFAVYMLTKYMRRIPKSIYEAAEIDGAGEWQIFTQICMPICRGGLASIAILIFIDYWNMVEQPLILLDNEELYPLSVFLSRINAGEISLAFAVAVIYMVLPMLFFLYGEEYLGEGILYQGGIKE